MRKSARLSKKRFVRMFLPSNVMLSTKDSALRSQSRSAGMFLVVNVRLLWPRMQPSYQTGLREGSLPGAVPRCDHPGVQERAQGGVRLCPGEAVRDRGEGRVSDCSKNSVLRNLQQTVSQLPQARVHRCS